jgi:hypothetical protein
MKGNGTADGTESGAALYPDRRRVPDAALGGRYRARGVEHDIYVVRLTSMRWQVLDVTATDVVIVDTLEGFDDRFEQARALASDYALEKQAHDEGRRRDDPLPRRSRTTRQGDSPRRS